MKKLVVAILFLITGSLNFCFPQGTALQTLPLTRGELEGDRDAGTNNDLRSFSRHVTSISSLVRGRANLLAQRANPPTVDNAFKLVVKTTQRPILIRIRTLLDGKPVEQTHEQAWNKYVTHLLKRLDADGDNFLDEKEAEGLLPPPTLIPAETISAGTIPARVAFNFQFVDVNGDGKVSVGELSQYYRDFGSGAREVRSSPALPTNAQNLSKRLMSFLDRDGDDRLSRMELAQSGDLLGKWDRNEDEMISLDELPVRVTGAIPIHVASVWGEAEPEITESFHVLGTAETPEEKALAKLPVDFDLIYRFGKLTPREKPVELVPITKKFPEGFQIWLTSTNVLQIQTREMVVQLRRQMGRPQLYQADRNSYLRRFANADRDEDGSLTIAETEDEFRTHFALLDENHDQRIQKRELISYLDQMRQLQAAHLSSRLALLVSDRSEGLMGMLDTNRDGRLSLREAKLLSGSLLRWDRDQDGAITEGELPHSYQLAIGLGEARLSFSGENGHQWFPFGHPMMRLDWATGNLAWFRKMDRNRDGDVSRREFLGPLDVFEKLDVDKDGLISAREASRADSLKARE